MTSIWRHRLFLSVVNAMAATMGALPTPVNNYLSLAGHQVWETEGSTATVAVVAGLQQQGLADVLAYTRSAPRFRVYPESRVHVSAVLTQAGINYQVLVPDLARHFYITERLVRREAPSAGQVESCTENTCPKPLTDKYMKYEQIEWYLKELAAKSSRVELKSIGKSFEGRDIWRVHIKSTSRAGAAKPAAVWLEGGLHAREWISPAVATHLIDKMVVDQTSVMRDVDVYVVPVANPDGYVYTWTTNRLWRKNTHPNKNRLDCPGVDLNRNWGKKFGMGASGNPCSEVYNGPHAFSEPETQALRDEMKSVAASKDLRLVIALHSYGGYLLYPWGFTDVPAPDTTSMKEAGKEFAKAAAQQQGTKYSVRNSAKGLYYASGATDDWAKAVLRTKYVYTLELPDDGTAGFILPANRIQPTAQEVWRGLKALVPRVR